MKVRTFKNMLFQPLPVTLADGGISVGGRGSFDVREDQETRKFGLLISSKKIKCVNEFEIDDEEKKPKVAPIVAPAPVSASAPAPVVAPAPPPAVETDATPAEPTAEVTQVEEGDSSKENDNVSLTNAEESVESKGDKKKNASKQKKNAKRKSQRR